MATLASLLLLALTGNFDDHVEQGSVPLPYLDNEVRDVVVLAAIDCVWNRESETLVLDVCLDFIHVLQGLSQLGLPA